MSQSATAVRPQVASFPAIQKNIQQFHPTRLNHLKDHPKCRRCGARLIGDVNHPECSQCSAEHIPVRMGSEIIGYSLAGRR